MLWLDFFKKVDVIAIYGRPNNAVGVGILLGVKKGNKKEFLKLEKEFDNLEHIRTYLKKFEGKKIIWYKSDMEKRFATGDIKI